MVGDGGALGTLLEGGGLFRQMVVVLVLLGRQSRVCVRRRQGGGALGSVHRDDQEMEEVVESRAKNGEVVVEVHLLHRDVEEVAAAAVVDLHHVEEDHDAAV